MRLPIVKKRFLGGLALGWLAYALYLALQVHQLEVASTPQAFVGVSSTHNGKDARETQNDPPKAKVDNKRKAHYSKPSAPKEVLVVDPIALQQALDRESMLAEQAKLMRQKNIESRVRRKNFRAEPHGHMVQPQLVLEDSSKSRAKDATAAHRRKQVLKAYLEPLQADDRSVWTQKPLPVRNISAPDLTVVEFPQLTSCRKLPSQFPVDAFPDGDPYLPWIHDVISSHDGQWVHFVAQNKRRCATGTTPSEEEALVHWEPQVTHFQHVSVKRLNTTYTKTPRYRLASHEQADPDAVATRFLCRFKDENGQVVEEKWSIFPNDYEWATVRKRLRTMFSKDGRNLQSPHTSQLVFSCPIPLGYQEAVRTGRIVVDDWSTLFVDVVPVRTPPRYGPPNEFLTPYYAQSVQGTRDEAKSPFIFNPTVEWGSHHVLPTVEDSGRWENIPICKPSLLEYEPMTLDKAKENGDNVPVQAHHLVSCLWTATGYTTRGNRFAINDGQRRLMEWITYNSLIGFEHTYIYDNSGAFGDGAGSLQGIVDLFPPGTVTVIPWPSRVCNNNPNNVDSPGERSSQYAAETSCRLRFGPHVKWIGQFDIDEYLIPMGNHESILPLLEKLDQEGKKIISFASWRAWPRRTHIDEPIPINDKDLCSKRQECFELTVPKNITLLEAYNCDRQKPGQKAKTMPAEKQIYRADYVKQHFIHYSTITESTNLNLIDYEKQFGHKRPFPDPHSRFGDEVNEALMLHSKAIARQDTAGWKSNCNVRERGTDTCRIGFPFPKNGTNESADADGWEYNCYVNEKVDNYWVPRLNQAMKRFATLADKF